MTTKQRLLVLLLLVALGGLAGAGYSLLQESEATGFIVLTVSGALAIASFAMMTADRDEQFFGLNQRGLRTIRSSGQVTAARVLEIHTQTQYENGTLGVRLRLDVAAAHRFHTWTATTIAVTDVPRYQPGQVIAVRHLPQFTGVVTVEDAPGTSERWAVERAAWREAREVPDYTGVMPKLSPSAGRATVSVASSLAVVALGAAAAYLIIGGTP